MRMTKSAITKLFVSGALAMVGGGVLAFVAVVISGMNGGFVMKGPDVVGIQGSGLGWSMAALAGAGILAAIGGLLAQFIAWIGAVINTAQLADKTWFVLLVVVGILSFGFVGMVCYLVAGPEGSEIVARRQALAASPIGGA